MTYQPEGQTRLLTRLAITVKGISSRGHVEQTVGDHPPDLTPDKQKAEIVIRRGST